MLNSRPKSKSHPRTSKKGIKLGILLDAIGMSRSTYYFEINKIDNDQKRNSELMEEIQQIFDEHKGRYGVRRIHGELINRGYIVNHKKVQRLMKKMNLKGKRPREKYHSYLGEVGKVADNIVNKDFNASRPNEKWTTDVTQFNLPFGKCYLSPILDMFNNEIISFNLSLSPNLTQISDMLAKAFENRDNLKGLLFHSDQGWQYQHKFYRERLLEKGIVQSMSRKGNCGDNGIMESFFGRLKNEMFYGYEKEFKTYEEFSKAIEEYIDYYNNKRIQAKTKWMPPVKFRLASKCVD